jgi:hypothetical protein
VILHWLVHTLARTGSSLARLSGWLWRQRIIGHRTIRLGMKTAFRVNRMALELLRQA